MSQTTKQALFHALVTIAGYPITFGFLSSPYSMYASVAWSAIVTIIAFYNTTAAKQTAGQL
jgi:hypothetical protein